MRAHAIYTSLRRRSEFTPVHQQGRRKGDAYLQVRVLPHSIAPYVPSLVRLGIIVSKKFGSAVARNRFKRVIRAAIRALGPLLRPGWDILVLPRAAQTLTSREAEHSLQALLCALGVLSDPVVEEEAG